jgi:two-component system alkaline phosphatase synthesis response regulator PhoP
MAAKRILVIEDEEDIRDLICHHLTKEGFQPQGVPDAESGLAEVRRQKPDAILLDLMLPDMQGNEFCRILKGADWSAGIPILMVTAKAEEIDRLLGFELGADDYITKPFSVRELIARLRAVLRRIREIPASAELPPYKGHSLSMDFASYDVRVRGKPVNLSLIEFRLLKHFVTHPNNVYSRSQLLDLVWGKDTTVMPRTVDVHIQKLRAQIEEDPRNPRMILTVRGAGYKFQPNSSAQQSR